MAHEFDNPTLALVRDLFIFRLLHRLVFRGYERTHNGRNSGGERREMDIVETAQDKCPVPSEAALIFPCR